MSDEAMIDEKSSLPDPPRRRLLTWLARGLGAVWAGGIAWVFGSFLSPPHSSRQDLVQKTLGAGPLDALPVGQGRLVRHRSEPIYVVRSSEDDLVALSGVCTHLHCILNYDAAARRLVCPCHAASFDLNGNVLEGPAPRPLRRYQVESRLGEIVVHTGRHPGGEA